MSSKDAVLRIVVSEDVSRLTHRGVWTNRGELVRELYRLARTVISACPPDSSLVSMEKKISAAVRKACR